MADAPLERDIVVFLGAGFVMLVGIGLVVCFLFFSGPKPRERRAPSPATSPWSATQPAETSWPASRLYWAVRIEDGAIIVDLEDGTEAVIRPRRDALERYGVKDIEGYPSLLARKLRRGYGDVGRGCLGKGDMGQTAIGLRHEFFVRLSDIATIELRKRQTASAPAAQPAMKPTAEGLTAALNLTPEQQTKVKAWLEAKTGQAVLNPAENWLRS